MTKNTSDGCFIFSNPDCVCGFDCQNHKPDNCFTDACRIIDRLCIGFRDEDLDMVIKYFTNKSSDSFQRMYVSIGTDGKDQQLVLYYYDTTDPFVTPIFTIIIDDFTDRKWFDWSKAKFKKFSTSIGCNDKDSELTLDDIKRFNAENKKKSERSKKSYNFGINEIRKICDYFGTSRNQVLRMERLTDTSLVYEKLIFDTRKELSGIFSVDSDTLFKDAYRTKCYVHCPVTRLLWTVISFPNEDKFIIRRAVFYSELAMSCYDDIYICSYDEDAKPIKIHDSKQ